MHYWTEFSKLITVSTLQNKRLINWKHFGGFNFDVYWGDGQEVNVSPNGLVTHREDQSRYRSILTKTVRLLGGLRQGEGPKGPGETLLKNTGRAERTPWAQTGGRQTERGKEEKLTRHRWNTWEEAGTAPPDDYLPHSGMFLLENHQRASKTFKDHIVII